MGMDETMKNVKAVMKANEKRLKELEKWDKIKVKDLRKPMVHKV